MVNVSGEKAAESLRVLASASAAALVSEKADAIDVGKDSLAARRGFGMRTAFSICLSRDHLSHKRAIAVMRSAVSQFLFERLAHTIDVAVLAEDEGKNEPVVSRAYLSIGTVIAHEGAREPRGGIGKIE